MVVCVLFPLVLQAQESTDRKVVPVISSTTNTEFSPTISADGRTMIFESDVDKKKGWELFESRLDDAGNWSVPVPIKAINDKCNFLAGPSLSYDGNTLYFTAFIEDVTESEDIYYSERLQGNEWSEPKSIGAPINTVEGYEGFPSISADGNSLYFIRVNEDNPYDKKNKENCFAIYVAKRKPDGSWGEPAALPAPINTGCERDPRIMADNHTLIFSSIRAGGKGKYDLYQARLQPNGAWAEPVALDFINAADNDQSPCISAAGDVMFFYSSNDLYSVTIPQQYRQMINVTVQGYVASAKTKEPLAVQIAVKDVATGAEFVQESSAIDGLYSLVLAAGKKYQVQFWHNSYVSQTLDFDFEKQDRYLEVKKDILLRPEYEIDLTVTDSDLKTKMKAWVQVSGSTPLVNDTIQTEQYPVHVVLEAGKDYQIKAAAPQFPEKTESLKFNPRETKEKSDFGFVLLHEKVRYTADVTNIVSNQKSKMKVQFTNETVDEVLIAESGDVVYLRKGDRYQVMTSSDKGFFFSSSAIVAGEGDSDGQGGYRVSLQVIPIEVGAQLTLNNITFASNSADLHETSYAELDRVIDLMQKNPSLAIEIAAHTDDVGDEAFNQRLSEKRALSVVTYLTKKNTPAARLKPVGFGKSKPIAPNDTEENKQKNRRVELHVLRFN